MTTKKIILPLLILSLLAGCNGKNDDSATGTTESKPTEAPASENTVPALKNTMFQEAGKENITFLEQIHIVNSSDERSATLKTMFDKDSYFGAIVSDDDESEILVSSSYYAKNGKVAYSSHPDRYNKVKEVTSSIRWDESVYVNRIKNLSKDDFQYVSKNEFGIATYVLTDNAIGNSTKKEIVDAIYDSATVYYHSGTASKFGGDSLSKMELYVSRTGITGFAMKYSKNDSTGRNYTELSVTLEDIGKTVLSEEDICPKPYSYETEYKTQYDSLDKALKEMKTYNYQIDVDVKRGNAIFQHSEAAFFSEGYSGFDQIISSSSSSYTYYGIHKRSDGKYERYTGETRDNLRGQIYRSSPHQGLMQFDFSNLIFGYDKENSTSSTSVFQIRPDFMKYNYIADIAEDMTFDEYASYAAGFTLKVEDSHLVSFSFPFSDNLGNSYSFTETISDHGQVTAIPNDIANFDSYQEYVSPISFKELTVGVMSLNDGSISSNITGDDALRLVYNSQALSKLAFPLTGDSAFYYDSATYIPASIIPSVLYLFFDEGNEDISVVFRKVLSAINSTGYSLTMSGEKTASQTIDSTYEISLDYSSGTLCLSYSTPYSFED